MLKFRVLMDRLRERLLNNNDLANGKLPPLMDIAKQENCSLSTVQRAIQELKKEGVVVTKTGQGTFSAASYPFEDAEKFTDLPVRFVNCCGFSMASYKMLHDFYGSLEGEMFKDGRSIHFYSLLKRNGVIIPLSERDLSISVCGNFLFSPFNEEILNNILLQCKNVISIDRDLTAIGVDSLVNDNILSGMMITNKLLEMGHRDIAYIGTHQSVPEPNGFDPALAERFRGFKTAYALKGIPLDEELCVPVVSRAMPGAVQAMDELFSRKKKFTAIVSYFSSTKFFVEYLQGKKLNVPEDITVATVGKTKSDNNMGGPAFSMENIGKVAWEMMKRRIEKTNRGVLRSADNAELYSIAPEFDYGVTIAPPKTRV